MALNELAILASFEEKSEACPRAKGVLQTFQPCPFCRSSSIGRVRRNFIECYLCKKGSIP